MIQNSILLLIYLRRMSVCKVQGKDKASLATLQQQLAYERAHTGAFSPSDIENLYAQVLAAQNQLSTDVHQQAIDLALDTLGMRGPVTRRQVAEEVIRSTTDDYWSYGDIVESKVAYLQTEIAARMGEPHSQRILDQYLPHIPSEYWPVLRSLPRFICISPRGGRDAQHVMAIYATADQWAANFELKDRIVAATTVSRNDSRNIRLLLESTGVRSLADLGSKAA